MGSAFYSFFAGTLANGIVVALFAGGLALTISARRFVPLSMAGTTVLCAYLAYSCVNGHSSILIAVATCVPLAALASALEQALSGQAHRHRLPESSLVVVSLGLFVISENLVALLYGDAPLRVDPSAVGPMLVTDSIVQMPRQWVSTSFGCAFIFASLWLHRASSFGTHLRAVVADRSLALQLGLPVALIEFAASSLGLFLATAGVLFTGWQYGLTPSTGLSTLILSLPAALILGRQSLLGTFLLGLAVGMLGDLAAYAFGLVWRDAFALTLLVVAVTRRASPWIHLFRDDRQPR